jgi:hypothetical protein
VIKVRFGGKTDCIDFSIFTTTEDKDYPNIDAIGYNRECAVNNQLDKNAGLLPQTGTVIMVKTALRFIKELYPNTKYFIFKDLSHITCYGKIQLRLSSLYIAKYGKTWYQMKFNAKPVKQSDKTAMKRTNSYLNQQLKMDYDIFYNKYIKPFHRSMRKLKVEQLYEAFKESYDSNNTYMEFFLKISENQDCIILQEWLPAFIRSICSIRFEDAEWKIYDDSEFQEINYYKINNKPFVTTRNNNIILGGSFPLGKQNISMKLDII